MSSYRIKTILKTIFEFLKKKLGEIMQRYFLMGIAALFVIFVVVVLLIWLLVGSR